MKNRRNYYRILHVQPDAPREIIRSSYRALMQKMRLHPDLGGDAMHAAMINEAYAILTNPENRAAYDRTRPRPEQFRPSRALAEPVQVTPAPALQCTFCGTLNECSERARATEFCGNCRSPLTLASQPPMEDDGRRSIVRVPRDHPIIFCTHWPQSEPCSGRTSDISLRGMKFQSNTGLSTGQIIKIDSAILRAVARVARSRPEPDAWVIGVEFVSLCFERSRGSFIADRV